MHLKYFLKLSPIFILIMLAFSACKKSTDVDPAKQLIADEALIKDFIAKNNISAIRHESGIYFQILVPGTGNITYSANTTVTANYTGRLLNGTVFDKNTPNPPLAFILGKVIDGWKIGVPLIQKGGKIRLFIPSGYGYGSTSAGTIPPNSVLDFDIELVDVQN